MENEKAIAVIGAGNGGFAMAADLALSGWKVRLHELPRFSSNLDEAVKEGGINMTGVANSGFAKLQLITSDMREAIDSAAYIMVVTQSLAHEEVAELISPWINRGQNIFIFPGSGGSLVFSRVFRKNNVTNEISLCDVLTLPYGCRKTGPNSVNVSRMLGKVGVATLPSRGNVRAFEIFQKVYPNSFLMNNVLEIAILNPNIIFHPAASMLNMARIEFSKGDFGLYQEGFSPSVMRVLDCLDQEIIRILKALGLQPISYKKLMEKRYERSFDEQFYGIMCRIGSKGPFDVKTRYITEDVPNGMLLVSSLGRFLGLETPTFDAVIQLCGIMTQIDYWQDFDPLERLGLSGMDLKAMQNYLKDGRLDIVQ